MQALRAYWLANVSAATRGRLLREYAALYVACNIGDDAVAIDYLERLDLLPDEEVHRGALLDIMRQG